MWQVTALLFTLLLPLANNNQFANIKDVDYMYVNHIPAEHWQVLFGDLLAMQYNTEQIEG